MRPIETWVLGYVLNALWQVPLVFAVAWVAARVARRSGAAMEHRIWSAALLAEALLPACSLRLDALMRLGALLLHRQPAAHGATVTVVMGAGQARGDVAMSAMWLDAAVVVYVVAVLWAVARLAMGWYRTMQMRARAQPVVLQDEARVSFMRLARVFGVWDVAVGSSAEVCGPVVLGVRRRMLLLPVAMASDLGSADVAASEDFAAALAHEFAHLQRRDFAKNLLYQVMSLPVAFHPLVWPTRARVAASREALCDALAADAVQGRLRYARSLVRLAAKFSERTRSPTIHAIGIFDANSFASFERRVMKLTEKQMEVRGVRRLAVAGLVGVLGFGACASALALRLQVAQPAQQSAPVVLGVPRSGNDLPAQTIVVQMATDPGTGAATGPVRLMTPTAMAADATVQVAQAPPVPRIPAGVMAGNLLTKVAPVYPPDAKEKKIMGVVLLKATIGKDGAIKSLQVESGPEELTRSATDAVQQWVYKPYLLNGNAVEVQTTISVNYRLQP